MRKFQSISCFRTCLVTMVCLSPLLLNIWADKLQLNVRYFGIVFLTSTSTSIISSTTTTTTTSSIATTPLLSSEKIKRHNIAPFEYSPDEYTDVKLPRLYQANLPQSHITATNYSLAEANCSATIILIKTARSNSARRNQMRRQLRKVSSSSTISHYFILGQSIDGENDAELAKESTKNGDLLFGEFIDTYDNLTMKSLSALDWARTVCGEETGAFLLIDDDVQFKNTAAVSALSRIPFAAVACLAMMKPATIPVLRDGKWAITRDEYSVDTYPQYCIGPAIGFTRKAAGIIIEVARKTQSFKIDGQSFTCVRDHQETVMSCV